MDHPHYLANSLPNFIAICILFIPKECRISVISFITKEHIDGLVQERRNSIALALELLLFCSNPSKWYINLNPSHHETYELLPDQGWIWFDFADFKHEYISKSDMHVFCCPKSMTGKFCSDWKPPQDFNKRLKYLWSNTEIVPKWMGWQADVTPLLKHLSYACFVLPIQKVWWSCARFCLYCWAPNTCTPLLAHTIMRLVQAREQGTNWK